MADVIVRKKDAGDEVAAFRSRFSKMGYCLSPEETVRLAPALLESIFPGHEGFLRFAQALKAL